MDVQKEPEKMKTRTIIQIPKSDEKPRTVLYEVLLTNVSYIVSREARGKDGE